MTVRAGREGRKTAVLLSTVITGLTNIAAPLFVQASGDLTVLGQFAVCSIPQTVAIAIARNISSQTLLRGQGVRQVASMQGILALVLGASSLATLLLVAAFGFPTFLALLAVVAPLSVVQDVFRLRCFGASHDHRALVADLIWFGSMLLGVLALVVLRGGLDVVGVLLVYGAGCACSVGYCALTWPSEVRDVPSPVAATPLFAEASAIFVLAQISQLVVAAILPVSVIGVVRSALTLTTPISLLGNLAQSLVIPRLDFTSGARTLRAALGVLATCLVASGLVLALLAVSPTSLRDLFGYTVDRDLYWAVTVTCLGFSSGVALSILLVRVRSTWPTRSWLTSRIVIAATEPLLTIPLALWLGPAGLASNALTGNALMTARIVARTTADDRSP